MFALLAVGLGSVRSGLCFKPKSRRDNGIPTPSKAETSIPARSTTCERTLRTLWIVQGWIHSQHASLVRGKPVLKRDLDESLFQTFEAFMVARTPYIKALGYPVGHLNGELVPLRDRNVISSLDLQIMDFGLPHQGCYRLKPYPPPLNDRRTWWVERGNAIEYIEQLVGNKMNECAKIYGAMMWCPNETDRLGKLYSLLQWGVIEIDKLGASLQKAKDHLDRHDSRISDTWHAADKLATALS